MAKKPLSIAAFLGSVLAIFQATVDLVLEFFFTKMETAAEKNKKTGGLAGAFTSVLGFFGEIGNSYFEKYEDLKRKKK